MTNSRIVFHSLLIVSAFSLVGCGDSGVGDVKQWMEETKRQTKISIPKLPEPKIFTPFLYGGKADVDPYSPSKLLIALAKSKAQSGTGIRAPDQDRRREPLEGYPLDSLKMVGTLEKPGLQYALLQADKTLFQAKIGNYVGQNFGIITGVSETAVEVKEIVQDASGDWVERKATLELQEKSK
ncbi:MAG: pilus assembly protein PilP [Pseudomonadota bacterium]